MRMWRRCGPGDTVRGGGRGTYWFNRDVVVVVVVVVFVLKSRELFMDLITVMATI